MMPSASCRDGTSSFRGAERLPPFLGLILNFLTGINKPKETRVAELLEVEMECWMDLKGIQEFKWTVLDAGVMERVPAGRRPRFVLGNKMADGAIWCDGGCGKSSGWSLLP